MTEVKPFAQGFMTSLDGGLDETRLCGVRCQDCQIALFGTRNRCENCSSDVLEEIVFSRSGEVASYTVQRHPPTEPFKLGSTDHEEWTPRPVGYVDLPEGVRILSIIDADPDEISIGDRVDLVVKVGWEEDGTDVLTYVFEPTGVSDD